MQKGKGMNRLKNKGTKLRVAGTMSGTSLDGVDVAVIETDGVSIHALAETAYRAFSRAECQTIAAALGQWQGPQVQAAADVVFAAHQDLLAGLEPVDLIGFHGQTLAHAPRAEGTLQVGDGAALAAALNTPVVWDFRSADLRLGGEGAPLAPFYHWACARMAGYRQPVVFLNLGGVGNLTWVDPRFDTPQAKGALLAFDTGPANAPINDFTQLRFGQAFDEGGKLAALGRIADGTLERFLQHPFFSRVPPKSLDRNEFKSALASVLQLSDNDAVATLTGMCAASVAVAMDHCPVPPAAVFVTGGGRHNPVLMDMLKAGSSCPVLPIEKIGFDGDMLEAQAFAFLAVRVLRGLPTSCPTTTGVRAAVGGGTISWPSNARAAR